MKKRILCLLFALLMVLSVCLTGCSEETDETKEIVAEQTRSPMTITLYGITGKSTTEEAIELVQAKLNEYTEDEFNTHVVLRLYPEDKYYDTIDNKIASIEKMIADEEAAYKEAKRIARENKKKGITTEADTTTAEVETELETYVNEWGVKKTIYPEPSEKSFDIFMVQGRDRLSKYYDDDVIASLNSAVNGTAKLIKKYLNEKLLQTAQFSGTQFGIPCNIVVGEYEYLLVNKELADKYYYDAASMSSLESVYDFLLDIEENEKDYIPLYNIPDPMVVNFNGIPMVGCELGMGTSFSNKRPPALYTDLTSYQAYCQAKYNVENNVKYESGDKYALPEGKKYAAAYIYGGPETAAKYEDDYYIMTARYPFADREDLPGTTFCVSNYANDVDRCMEIVTALITNSDFVNTFYYGIKGTHYDVDPLTGLIDRISDDWSMDIKNIGNMFLLKQSSEMDDEMMMYSANDWKIAKAQNRDLTYSPYLLFTLKYITKENYLHEAYGFKFDEKGNLIGSDYYAYLFTQDVIDRVSELGAKYEKLISEYEEVPDEKGKVTPISNYVRRLNLEANDDLGYQQFKDVENNYDSIRSQYNDWYDSMNFPQ